MKIYINSFEAISPQNTFDSSDFLSDIIPFQGDYFSCITPKYSDILDPKVLRRMSKIVKMGTATAKVALQKADISNPDAIIIGTGLGCIEDTVKFLAQMIENNEQLLNPTAFIQSTHNTVSGQIALMLGCKNYNLTYTQKSASFESALLDAILMLKSNEAMNILVGGIDEVTSESYNLLQLAGCAKTSGHSKNQRGFIPGEGAAFFVVTNQNTNKNIAEIRDISLCNSILDNDKLAKMVDDFLEKNHLSTFDIDVIMSGMNGDSFNDIPHQFVNEIFSNSLNIEYKSLVGEYDTASAFSLYLASKMIEGASEPSTIKTNNVKNTKTDNILIYNSFNHRNHSLILISRC